MDIETPDFLGGEPAPVTETVEAPAPVVETPQTEAPAAPTEGQPRGPDGKFASAEAPAAAPVAAETPHHVPLPTYLDMRDKFTAAEKRAAELETWRKEQEAAAARQPIPDRDTDPAAYEAFREQQRAEEVRQSFVPYSRRFAVTEHGKDAVEAAEAWYEQTGRHDVAWNSSKVWSSKDPYGEVMAKWRESQIVSKVDPNDYDAFLSWKASQPGGAPSAAPAAPPAAPTPPRPSLAASPSAASHSDVLPKDGEATFEAMFK